MYYKNNPHCSISLSLLLSSFSVVVYCKDDMQKKNVYIYIISQPCPQAAPSPVPFYVDEQFLNVPANIKLN